MNDSHFKFTNSVLLLPLFFVLSLWFVYWLEIRFDFDFVENGIYPRTLSGLQGILFSPFIHADMGHLYNNSVPLLILLAALQFFYPKQAWAVLGYGILFSGMLTWAIGRVNYHIGGSGVVYVLVSFIFFKGIQTKYYRLVALSLTVIVVYGGMVWYVFPKVDETISWEGHLAGLITGFALSLLYKTPEYKKVIKYDWEHPDFDPLQDRFMQRFDASGKFVNLPEPEESTIESSIGREGFFSSNTAVIYDFVSKENNISKKNESKPES